HDSSCAGLTFNFFRRSHTALSDRPVRSATSWGVSVRPSSSSSADQVRPGPPAPLALCASDIFFRDLALCFFPRCALPIAWPTSGGRLLPLLAAAIFSSLAGLESVGLAAMRASARCPSWTALFSVSVPSVFPPTPSALRQRHTVSVPTPQWWQMAAWLSRYT